jgi:hypothetical protein
VAGASPPLSHRVDCALAVEDSKDRLVLLLARGLRVAKAKGSSVYLPTASVPSYHQMNAFCYQEYATRAVEIWANGHLHMLCSFDTLEIVSCSVRSRYNPPG